ncbi:MAG: hypothetical protein AAB215_00690 [Planctomycetota bacterium]
MESLFRTIDAAAGPFAILAFIAIALAVLLVFYRTATRPAVAILLFALALAALVFALRDPHFSGPDMLGKPDNIPIAALFFLVAFFLWLGLRQAALNDGRADRGLPSLEAERKGPALVFPDLVFSELIAALLVSALLLGVSVVLKAPLEQPADPSNTPNPSKAPWYFVGLQELLAYFPPWIAGVLVPALIIAGLMAIPYIDRNPRGAGFFTLRERPLAISLFLFGFVVLWLSPILLGTFLRGPNWNFFGPFEAWDPFKPVSLPSVDFSDVVWGSWAPALGLGAGAPSGWLLRELPGLLAVGLYLAGLPWLLGRTLLRKTRESIGPARWLVFSLLLALMLALPIKMILCWAVNLRALVSIPELAFHI